MTRNEIPIEVTTMWIIAIASWIIIFPTTIVVLYFSIKRENDEEDQHDSAT